MISYSRSICLLVFVLAACSSAGTTSDDRSPDDPSTEPTKLSDPLAISNSNNIPDEQRQYFEDGQVTLAEYQEAYGAFTQCAVDAGVGSDLREQGRDEATGVIMYSTQTELFPPGQFDGTMLNDCYQRQFVHVEIAFQTSDPAVLAALPQEQIDLFNQNIRPCLEQIGVEVPGDLEFNDENWAQLNEEAVRAFEDGRCGSGVEGG